MNSQEDFNKHMLHEFNIYPQMAKRQLLACLLPSHYILSVLINLKKNPHCSSISHITVSTFATDIFDVQLVFNPNLG